MDYLSAAKWAIIAILILGVGGTITWQQIALKNRATQISSLNDKLTTQKGETEKAVKTANDNASALHTLHEILDTTQDALEVKGTKDAKLAARIAGLQSEVKHAKASTCVSPAIITAINGVRYLQSATADDGTRPANPNASPKIPDNSAATTNGTTDPNQAASLIAQWITDIYAHDTGLVTNLEQIRKLQPQ